jgi:hypothetical protein
MPQEFGIDVGISSRFSKRLIAKDGAPFIVHLIHLSFDTFPAVAGTSWATSAVAVRPFQLGACVRPEWHS